MIGFLDMEYAADRSRSGNLLLLPKSSCLSEKVSGRLCEVFIDVDWRSETFQLLSGSVDWVSRFHRCEANNNRRRALAIFLHCRHKLLSCIWHASQLIALLLRLFTSTWSRLLFRSWRQRQLPRTHAVVFWRDDMLPTSKLHWKWPGNPNGRSKLRNLFCLRLRDHNYCFGGGSAADGGFRRSLKRHVANIKNIAGKTRINRNSANMKIFAYKIKQNVSKNFFLLLRTSPLLTALRTVFFYYHLQRLLFSPTKNNFSTNL